MKILDRYIISSFIKPFVYSVIVFSLFMFFGAAFEKLQFFIKANAGILLLGKYLFFQFPFFISLIIPISYLLGTLFLINSFMVTGQWKAFIAGGYKPFDIVRPLMFFAIFIGVLHFIFNEFIVTPAFLRSKIVYNEELKGNLSWHQKLISNSFTVDDKVIYYSSYDPSEKKFEDVVIEVFHNDRPVQKIKASSMNWESGRWVLNEAKVIDYLYVNEIVLKENKYKRFYIDLIAPENLVLDKVIENGINFFDLCRRISRLKYLGIKSDIELIFVNFKISQPLSSFTMCFIGCAIVLSGVIYGKFLSIGIAIFTGFIYWSLSVIAQRMAEIKALSPFFAAFLPHLIFISLGILIFRKGKII